MKKILTLLCALSVVLCAQARIEGASHLRLAATTTPKHTVANPNGTNFTIATDSVEAASLKVLVTPKDDEMGYYFDLIDASYWGQFDKDDYAGYVKEDLDETIEFYGNFGYTLTYADFLSVGKDSYTFTGLMPETEYIVIAFGLDGETCAAITDFDTIHVTTAAGVMSDNVITMAHNNGIINITTTNSDPYFFIFESQDEYDEYQSDFTQQSLISEINGWINAVARQNLLAYFIHAGNEDIDIVEMYNTFFSADPLATGDYIALAVAYNEYINGEAAYLQFHFEGTTAVEDVQNTLVPAKRLINGQVVIEKNGTQYNILGAELK